MFITNPDKLMLPLFQQLWSIIHSTVSLKHAKYLTLSNENMIMIKRLKFDIHRILTQYNVTCRSILKIY